MINLGIGALSGLIFGGLAIRVMNNFFVNGKDGEESAELKGRWLIVIIFAAICAICCSFLGYIGLTAILVILTIFSFLNNEGENVGAVVLLAGLPFMIILIAKIIEDIAQQVQSGGLNWQTLLWLIPVIVFVLSNLIKSHIVEMREIKELEETSGEKPKRDWIPSLVFMVIVLAMVVAVGFFIWKEGMLV